jgi:hypothetical protein
MRGFPVAEYGGQIEVPADDALTACKIARRIVWASKFPDRPMDCLKVWIAQPAEAA